jgi:hypothetical protein
MDIMPGRINLAAASTSPCGRAQFNPKGVADAAKGGRSCSAVLLLLSV